MSRFANESTAIAGLSSFARRKFLEIGCSSLFGLTLPSLLSRQMASGGSATPDSLRRARSVLVLFTPGAPSQLETFDPKPNAPAEVRGPFQAIGTATPGIQICEHLPELAKRSGKFALVRSMTHDLPEHEHASHFVTTGIDRIPPGSTHMSSRADWPCYSATVDALRPPGNGVPTGVLVPAYMGLPYNIPGQDAGFLGAAHDPFTVKQDPNAADFRVDGLGLPKDLSKENLAARRRLLASLNEKRVPAAVSRTQQEFSGFQEQAFSMLTASAVSRAFSLDREPVAVRVRYGRHLFGQSFLLARRLLEAGVPVVHVNVGGSSTWDTHGQQQGRLKDYLLPQLDRGLAALLDDMSSSGLLNETLIVMLGEFGRTPKLGGYLGTADYTLDGRDHWSGVFTALFAGGGVQGGQVVGASDRFAAWPASSPYHPSDVGATIYSALGIDPRSVLKDRLARPLQLNEGHVIEPLYTGAS